jgi:hypothetical protein
MAWGYNSAGQYGWFDEPGAPNPITGAAPPPPTTSVAAGAQSGLAKPVANPGSNGSNMRYQVPPGTSGNWTDGVYWYDANGLSLDRPDQPVAGLPPANESESYNVYTGEVKSGGGGGGGGAGYGSGGGPYVEQMRSMLQAQGTADLSNTQAAIRKALIGFGIVPEGFDDKLGVLDDVTKNLIAKNQESGISYYARLLEQKKSNLQSTIGRLSNTGMRRSGAKGKALRKGQLDFDRLFSDSLQELLGQVGNLYSGYAGNEQNRQMQLMQAMMSGQNQWSGAGSTQQAAPSGGGGGGWTPSWQGTWAEGIDTGGYVPGSGVITDYGPTQPTYNLGNGVIAY